MSDDRLGQAKAMPIADVAHRLGIDWLKGSGPERVGACPVCGGHEKRSSDRFSINKDRNVFHCRKCPAGGDQVALVQHALGCDFKAALEYLAGKPVEISRAEKRRREKIREKAAREQAQIAERMRARAIRDAREIWHSAEGFDVSPARAYLAGRGLTLEDWPPTLRFHPDHPYRKATNGGPAELHRGPCMIAAIQNPQGRITAVHQTWIDSARPGHKAEIYHGEDLMPAKLVRGSKKGGAIRLSSAKGARVMVMGEGIETTLSARVAGIAPGAAFWAGVDLGNMSGRQSGRNSGRPDMSDLEAFVPPDQIDELVFIQDGDSDPKSTRAKLEAGLIRAQLARAGRTGRIIAAEAGRDLNDMIRER